MLIGRRNPRPGELQSNGQLTVGIGKNQKGTTFDSVRRDAYFLRTTVEQERLNAAVFRDNTVE